MCEKDSMARGILSFPCGNQFTAISGGYGKGALPSGDYHIEKCYKLYDDGNQKPFKRDGDPWVATLVPQFKTDRTGLLIHPDGNLEGTLGCIGITEKDMKCFDVINSHLSQNAKLILSVKS